MNSIGISDEREASIRKSFEHAMRCHSRLFPDSSQAIGGLRMSCGRANSMCRDARDEQVYASSEIQAVWTGYRAAMILGRVDLP